MPANAAFDPECRSVMLGEGRKEFERALRRFLVQHATRGALLRRLTEAGLWSG